MELKLHICYLLHTCCFNTYLLQKSADHLRRHGGQSSAVFFPGGRSRAHYGDRVIASGSDERANCDELVTFPSSHDKLATLDGNRGRAKGSVAEEQMSGYGQQTPERRGKFEDNIAPPPFAHGIQGEEEDVAPLLSETLLRPHAPGATKKGVS